MTTTITLFDDPSFFDRPTGALWVRVERLDSLGGYVQMLAHTLAHLKVGQLARDDDPEFIRKYYAALEALLSDATKRRSAVPVHDGQSIESVLPKLLEQNEFADVSKNDHREALIRAVLWDAQRAHAPGPASVERAESQLAFANDNLTELMGTKSADDDEVEEARHNVMVCRVQLDVLKLACS